MRDKKMYEYTESNEAILLFERYTLDSQRLYASFKCAGCNCIAIAIEDNGFLPEDVMSVYGYFIEDFRWKQESYERNCITAVMIPECQKKDENKEHESYGTRGELFYVRSLQKRCVKTVNWLDNKDVVQSSDHYNQYGAMYARTIFNAKGQKVKKSWFTPEGRKVIVEDFNAGNITLYEGDDVNKFENKRDLVVYFFAKTGFWRRQIFLNSLSMPFFVCNKLRPSGKKVVLFWQETMENEIPENMKMILSKRTERITNIVVQKKCAYDQLLKLGADADSIYKLGYVYHFRKENRHRPETLICTNSENVEHCQEIVKELPRMHFHIAAVTAMSEKLLSVGAYENVSLYQGAGMDVLQELFKKCDYYLDINHYGEIVSSVYRAFLHNHLIFAFAETVHNRDYVADRWIYPAKDWKKMVEDIQVIMEDAELLDRCIERQHEEALAEDKVSFRMRLRSVV